MFAFDEDPLEYLYTKHQLWMKRHPNVVIVFKVLQPLPFFAMLALLTCLGMLSVWSLKVSIVSACVLFVALFALWTLQIWDRLWLKIWDRLWLNKTQ